MDSTIPSGDDHSTDPRAPNARTAIANNAWLMLISLIATSFLFKPTITLRDQHDGSRSREFREFD
jgi:hypothetical protein